VAIDGTIQNNLDEIDWTVVGVSLDLGADPNMPDKIVHHGAPWVWACELLVFFESGAKAVEACFPQAASQE